MMLRQRHNEQGDAEVASRYRAAVKQVSGGGSLQALCACLDQVPAASVVGLDTLAQDLAFIGQQLHALSSQSLSTQPAAAAGTQQQQPQQPGLAPDVLQACVRFCKAVTDALAAAIQRPQQDQQQQHSRWRHSQRHHHRQQQQAQQPQQLLLPAAAATALCSCLRQWADPMLYPAATSCAERMQDLQGQQESDLPQAAVTALGALLPTQLPVISAHERAAVLALLLALVQPPTHNSSSSSSTTGSGGSSSSRLDSSTGSAVAPTGTDGKQEDTAGSQHWTLACKAAVALTDVMSEALRNSSAAAATAAAASAAPANSPSTNSSSSKPGSGLQPEEAASITAGLVVALSTSCGTRSSGVAGSSSSGSRSGSTGGAAAGHSSSSTGGGARIGSTGGASSGSRQQPCEGLLQSQYYASLLVALNHAVNSNKQGWQIHAGAITESLRKLFTYGTQQQQQQQAPTRASQQPQQQRQQANQDAKPPDSSSATAAATPAGGASVSSQQPPKRKYVPPHARAAAGAAAAGHSPSKQQQQQQRWQDSSDESEQSPIDWSDVSDSESFHGGSSSSRRASSSSNTTRSSSSKELKQQQQQLHDPIKAVRVRSALLQLLQVLVQADPRALHPYWAALLPSQAPLQSAPLSPHLLTVLLYDPSDKVRLLAAGVLGALLEGPTARSLLAVAEAKTAHPNLRGFTTMSVSLGHMVLCLHAGLLAVVTAWQQQQQIQQQQQQQQGGTVLQVPAVLLTAVLRVLCVLVPVTPYERLPSTLLTDTVDSMWQLWQQQHQQGQQPAPAGTAAAAATLQASNGCIKHAAVPPLALSAAAAAAGGGSLGYAPNSSSSSSIHVAAVLAQAFSTKKPHPALGRWLQESVASGSSSSSSSSRGAALIRSLLAAAAAPDCLLRIEALATLRGCCINYPAVIEGQSSAAGVEATAHAGSATTRSSSSSTRCTRPVQQQQQLYALLFAAVDVSVVAAAVQPSSARSTPRSSPRASSTIRSPAAAADLAAAAAAADGSGSTSPEVKAGQHAVRLLGDWLAAAAAVAPDACAPLSAGDTPQQQQQQQQQETVSVWASQWVDVLQLLLSDSIWGHPSPVIRSAAAAVCSSVPAGVWLALPQHLRARLLAAAAATAAGADVTAVRAAACKLLGSCAVMPGVLGGHHQQQQQHGRKHEQQQEQQEQQQGAVVCEGRALLQALGQCVSDEAVSVRLSAAWALSNVCDELRHQVVDVPQQQQQQQRQQCACEAAGVAPAMAAAELRVLCDAANAAAGDTEKVRAHGVRAVGALLAAWQPCWGLDSSRSSSSVGGSGTVSSDSSSSVSSNAQPAAAAAAAGAAAGTTAPTEDWSWVAGWFKAAFGSLQSCLAARSMKVVWNAAVAAAAGLHNTAATLAVPAVADSNPGLLRMLVVLVRDSSNYKIKTHAAAALAAPPDRGVYGEVFADSLLVLLAALQALQGSSSSSSSSSALVAAAADGQQAGVGGESGLDDEGAFPNYRYIPGLQAQLESSLCHLLSLLQPSDASRLREQLRRHQPLLLSAVARACPQPAGSESESVSATAFAGQQQEQQQLLHAAAGAASGSSDRAQQPGCAGRTGGRGLVVADNPAAADTEQQFDDSNGQQQGAAAAAAVGGTTVAQASQQQHQAQSALPADPFGQGGTGVSRDNSAGAGSKGSAATAKQAGPAGSSPRKAGALNWGAAAAVGTGAVAGKGAALTAVGGPAAVAGCERVGVSEGAKAALQGLCSVLGPSVLDAWSKQQVDA